MKKVVTNIWVTGFLTGVSVTLGLEGLILTVLAHVRW